MIIDLSIKGDDLRYHKGKGLPADLAQDEIAFKIWARSITGFVPGNDGGFAILGDWAGVGVPHKQVKSGDYAVQISSRRATGLVIVCVTYYVNGNPFAALPGSYADAFDPFRVVAIIDANPITRAKRARSDALWFEYDNSAQQRKKIQTMFTVPKGLRNLGIFADKTTIVLPDWIDGTAPNMGRQSTDVAAYDSTYDLLNIDQFGVSRALYDKRLHSAPYRAAVASVVGAHNGKHNHKLIISQKNDAPQPNRLTTDEASVEKKVASDAAKQIKKAKKRQKIRAGGKTVNVPKGWATDGKFEGLHAFVRNPRRKGGGRNAVFAMLDDILKEGKDLEKWERVANAEVQELEKLLMVAKIVRAALRDSEKK